MTTTSEDIRDILENYLLGTKLYDSYTLERFTQLFPSQYRQYTSEIANLYAQFQRQRDLKRDELETSISVFCEDLQEQENRHVAQILFADAETSESLAVENSVKAAVELLKAEKSRLKSELKELANAEKKYKKKLEDFERKLDALPAPQHLKREDIEPSKLKSVLQILGANE